MHNLKYILIALFFISCSHISKRTSKVTIIKQWHLSPNINTFNVEAARELPHYVNQRDIYDQLVELLENSSEPVAVIAEGCESGTVMGKSFAISFNGWNAGNLRLHTDKDHYADIMTSAPLKLKMKYPDRVKAVCGDNESLVKKNLLDLSEAKGYLGFHYRLEESKNNPKKYRSYLDALEETEKKKIPNPIQYCEEKALVHVRNFWQGISKRNASFVSIAKVLIQQSPVIVIGGLHVKDLEKQLKEEGIEVQVITPKGYPENSENLGQELTKVLTK